MCSMDYAPLFLYHGSRGQDAHQLSECDRFIEPASPDELHELLAADMQAHGELQIFRGSTPTAARYIPGQWARFCSLVVLRRDV